MARGRKSRIDWSTYLPRELLRVVLLHLPCLIDRVYFAAICRAWRSAARGEGPPRQLPWLVLPFPGAASFFAHQIGRTRRLNLPESIHGARLCGSHDGSWVAATSEAWRGYAAVNILSRVKVPLPNRIRVFHPLIVSGTSCPSEHPMLIRTVTFSAAPTSAHCIAAAHISSACNIAFWRPGMDAYWLGHSHELSVVEDIIYCRSLVKQGFYVLRDTEDLLVYAVSSDQIAPLELMPCVRRFEKRMDYNHIKSGFSVSRYLVESRGKLLMVLREYSVRGVARCTRVFRIFEMVETLPRGQGKASWVELLELHGRALFLGRGASRAVEVSQFTGLQEGAIYYLDDTSFDISLVLSSGGMFSSSDMGVYSMARNKKLTRDEARRFPHEFASECSPPIWLLN
ncbi:hypothetical protein BAE44_0005872 [Dichanthelium oligosanthes]|uniref:KIB1-4 beta-propeller domain-containing protein n=1 Tax=Dichanthelium oligosanthes TaxID=888268 RepID=A0A1E5W796_9POAL|nr:hypothetical protein BAE44_0005872 [Dichanthelium oligosanthes]